MNVSAGEAPIDHFRVLLVEDDDDDSVLINRLLALKGGEATVKEVESYVHFYVRREQKLSDSVELLKRDRFDVVLLDLNLPDAHGVESLLKLLESVPHVPPVLVVTGLRDESVALDCMRKGAQDYILKDSIEAVGLIRAIRYAVERQRLARLIERSNQDLEQFAFMAAHDLRIPLQNIGLLTNLLQVSSKHDSTDQEQKFIQRIQGEIRWMGIVIDDLLTFCRVTRSEQKSSIIDLNEVVRDVLRRLSFKIEASEATIEVGQLPQVRGDEVQLALVIQNLILNSLTYRSTRAPVVTVSAAEADGFWIICVRDNGAGIAKTNFDAIFDVFKRVDTGSDRGGMGLGLAICKRIVESHKGRMWVESEVGHGSAFYFTLPLDLSVVH